MKLRELFEAMVEQGAKYFEITKSGDKVKVAEYDNRGGDPTSKTAVFVIQNGAIELFTNKGQIDKDYLEAIKKLFTNKIKLIDNYASYPKPHDVEVHMTANGLIASFVEPSTIADPTTKQEPVKQEPVKQEPVKQTVTKPKREYRPNRSGGIAWS
jgi:phosphoribosylamine-glycine ligase